MTIKPPRMYVKSKESYASAYIRWRKRMDDYRDYCIMLSCLRSKRNNVMIRACWGLTLKDMYTTFGVRW